MTDRLAELTCRYLDRVITPDEFAELDALIARDPQAAVRFRELSVQSRILSEPLRDRIEQLHAEHAKTTPPVSPVSAEGVPMYRKGCEPQPFKLRPHHYALIAATLLAACGLAAYLLTTSVDPEPSAPEPSSPPPLATLIRSPGHANLTTPGGFIAEGRDYPRGEYALSSGTAEFMLTNSVNVKMRGDTRLHMRNDMNVSLTRGSAEFVCPPAAAGFTVQLPGDARVVDLGTRFEIETPPTGPSEIRVLEGRVRIERGDESVELTPARIATIDPATGAITLRPAPINLVVNPGFEEAVEGDPTAVAAWIDYKAPDNLARTNEQARTGDCSLKFFTAPAGPASSDVRQNIDVTQDQWGKPFKFSMWVLCPSGDQAVTVQKIKALVRPRKADDTILSTQITTAIGSSSPTDQWIELTLEGVVPDDTQRFLIQLNAGGLLSSHAGAIYIDDIELSITPPVPTDAAESDASQQTESPTP